MACVPPNAGFLSNEPPDFDHKRCLSDVKQHESEDYHRFCGFAHTPDGSFQPMPDPFSPAGWPVGDARPSGGEAEQPNYKSVTDREKEKCNPNACGGYLCIRVCPINREGEECISKAEDGKAAFLTDDWQRASAGDGVH